MTAATILKRINSQRKEITRYQKEIARYQKEWCGKDMPEHMVKEGKRWIEYYQNHILRVEKKIAEMSKQAAELATEEEKKQMIRDMAEELAKRGIKWSGYTTKGLHYSIEGNHGVTERSRYCWTMYMEGHGTVFTSGTLETVAEYILNN